MRLIDADESVGIGYLSDWYQNSINDTKPPIWTDGHIEELTNDFIIIPKAAPTVDAVEVVRCRDCKKSGVLEHSGKMFCKEPMGYLGCVPTKPDNFCSYGERRDTDG